MRASADYLKSVWSGDDPTRIHAVWAPTIKLGMIVGLDSPVEPAITWQAVSLGRRPDHMSLVHLDLGWTIRGFFGGAAATINGYMDFGIARRLTSRIWRPYVSLHVVL